MNNPLASEIPAFLRPGSAKDAAIIRTLEPGAYTVILSGGSGSAGIGLLEVYEYYLQDHLAFGEFNFFDHPANVYGTDLESQTQFFFSDTQVMRDEQDAKDYVRRMHRIDERIDAIVTKSP